MKKIAFRSLFVFLSIFLFFPAISEAQSNTPIKPNILIIFTDDQGYADLGCYGNTKHRTPRLDELADEGMMFTSFYAQPICGQSRSALLTGRYPVRSKGWNMPASEITIAELLKNVGYQTACIGKWDVSNRKAIIDRMPNAQGFDYYFGTLGANDNGFVKFYHNNNPAGETTDMGSLIKLYTDKSIDFLKNKRNPDKPFLLYLAHTMMHVNIDASPEFKGKSTGGLYGDVMEEFDYETGRLLDIVDELGLSENTLIIYTSDNGPWCQPKYYLRKKGLVKLYDFKREPEWYTPEDSIFWGDPGPLRGAKGSAYEAGSRVPCIVRWPGKVPEGSTSDAIFATIDFLPTFSNLTGFEIPRDRKIDGIDQTDLLLGKSEMGRETFIYGQGGENELGIRKGKWKLLLPDRKRNSPYLMDFGTNDYELYNLEADIGERWNMVDIYPEKVEELKAMFVEETKK